MKFFSILLKLSMIASFSSSAFASSIITEVGNGGDMLQCKTGFYFSEGTYSLDYVVTYNHDNNNDDVYNFNWKISSDRIISKLNKLAPALAKDLQNFRSLLFNEDPTKDRVWNKRHIGLVDLKDEVLWEEVPEECQIEDANGNHKLLQAVIREKRTAKTIYSYNPILFDSFTLQKDDINASFIAIHEWLWDFNSNARVIRDINRILHSKTLDKIMPDQFQLMLEGYGMAINGNPEVSSRSMSIELINGQLVLNGNSPFIDRGNWQTPELNIFNATDFNAKIKFNRPCDNTPVEIGIGSISDWFKLIGMDTGCSVQIELFNSNNELIHSKKFALESLPMF